MEGWCVLLFANRCGWMPPVRSSSVSVWAWEDSWLSQATTSLIIMYTGMITHHILQLYWTIMYKFEWSLSYHHHHFWLKNNTFDVKRVTFSARWSILDVRFWRLMSIPALKEKKIFIKAVTHNTGIQMKRKELTKTFKLISNLKKLFVFHGLYKTILAL